MGDIELTSTSNPKIKRLIGLRERAKRDREGVFLVEGPRHLKRALGAGHRPLELYFQPGEFDPATVPGVEAHSCSEAALSKASYRAAHEGVIAVFEQFDHGLGRIEPGEVPLLLVAEGLEKPGNLGAILRTADAVGADGVIAVGGPIDIFNPNVIRASTGAVFSVPVAVSDLAPALDWLAEQGIPVTAASPDSKVSLWSVDLTGPTALLVGSESAGLSQAAREAAAQMVMLPMHGTADSLNASVTLSILAYEAIRQRSRAS